MNRTKIDWCDYTWNPVWGCLTGCEYCYARKLAKRFWKQMYIKELRFQQKIANEPLRKNLAEFKPVFLQSNFNKKFPGKPSKIFVNSMSDIRWWKKHWMKRVLEKIKEYPQHTFLFLTKFPAVYEEYKFPQNCWLGVTFTGSYGEESRLEEFGYARKVRNRNLFFFSLEPFLDNYLFENYLLDIEWVIVGAQTNPYQPPKREWIEEIIKHTRKLEIKLFIKDNVYRAYPDLPVIKEFPANL